MTKYEKPDKLLKEVKKVKMKYKQYKQELRDKEHEYDYKNFKRSD